MTLDEAEEIVGHPVEYTAFKGARHEYGIVTDTGPGYALVQFGGCSYSRAVHPRDLRRIAVSDAELQRVS